jgi:diguanylate cyclase (GGDEF)-like protein/PAS domain S-box-containing protein
MAGVAVNAVVSVDASGRIAAFNPAAERTFGHAAAEVVGKPFALLLAGECHETYRLQVDQLFSSEDAINAGRTLELRGTRSDGSQFPLELCLVTWRSSADALYTCIVRDVSARERIAHEREELMRQVEALALTDELTALPNRRAWDAELSRELARATRSGDHVWVALLDLDHFKHYNDQHGHQAGDAFLRQTAVTWRTRLRPTDLLARYGGEEFAALLSNCSIGEASEIVERMRAATPEGETCSAGLVRWDGLEGPDALVGRADLALYEAKRAGRDRLSAAVRLA